MTLELTADLFDGHVGQTFRVGGVDLALVLTAVERRAMQAWEAEIASRPPFTLVFRGPADAILPEGLRTLEAEGGPAYDLYIIPTHTPSTAHQNYQAVFN
jgi:hypothetical protein